ncbi:receptor-like cytosolic serine/threonine-protein kinase RBK2 isoform X2 [Jatropha curcas]|uniref:receptor-like cytosolic serine/threonine-protein kinase RBK2 isoform X2 n=1 Tax=Jatropha curcas TaxID=180498 RepID=UPI0009D72421|nr:receptor-like cytosolic serine/threonine-protein kinase RBK2 isoform X2 [Jatropha curcas]
MATAAGRNHHKSSSNTISQWENGKELCQSSGRSQRAETPPPTPKHKKFSKLLSFAGSTHDKEKERQDGYSPTGVIEACLEGLESTSIPPDIPKKEAQASSSKSRAQSHWGRFIRLWKKRSLKHLNFFSPLPMPKLPIRKSRSSRENPLLRDLYKFKSSLEDFTLSQLEAATNNFSPENLIGKGGFAEVYKGRLRNGKLVAIKRLTKGTSDEQTGVFLSELGIMAYVDHPNTAKLLGCGIDGGMFLVFELSPLGSLGSVLRGSQVKLEWSKRCKIALGTADGLMYLHEGCQKRIIHRDIKIDNILLTEDYVPQICDFGLAKWLPRQWTHHNVQKFEGTFGYFAPEYFMHGIVDEKTDIYSFGVLLLELITGRPAIDHLQQSLVAWAKPFLDNNDIKELADPSLGGNYDPEEMDRIVLTASLCIEPSPILRPRINQVVILLRGDEYAKRCAKERKKKSFQRTYSEELLDAQEYNSTKYLNDLKRHRELALGC